MITRRECVLAFVAALAGFLGGALSNRVAPVHAQERSWQKSVIAEKFVVVDASDAKRVEIGVEAAGQGNLKVYDEHGRLAWSVPDLHLWPASARAFEEPAQNESPRAARSPRVPPLNGGAKSAPLCAFE